MERLKLDELSLEAKRRAAQDWHDALPLKAQCIAVTCDILDTIHKLILPYGNGEYNAEGKLYADL
jgi:hypothetical protein